MVTDPPYGVEYEPNWRNEATRPTAARTEAASGPVTDDAHRSTGRRRGSLCPARSRTCGMPVCHGAEVAVSLPPPDPVHPVAESIWAKPTFIIARGHYHWQHEPCWYSRPEGLDAKWCGDRKPVDALGYRIANGIGRRGDGSTTMQRPSTARRRTGRMHGAADAPSRGADVYDPFSGSGTTLIAGEQLGRHCFAIELEPAYCQLAIDRWEAFTPGSRPAQL